MEIHRFSNQNFVNVPREKRGQGEGGREKRREGEREGGREGGREE